MVLDSYSDATELMHYRTPIARPYDGGESLPSLIGRLGEDIVTLLDTKLGLLKLEIKEDVEAYVRGRVSIGVGGIIAALGFSLLNVAIAFLVPFARREMNVTVKQEIGPPPVDASPR